MLADGYAYKQDGTWVTDVSSDEISNVTVQEAPTELFCASVTEADNTVHNYLTLNKAVAAAQSMSGSTVKLLKDVTSGDNVYITSGTFTIDLNGKTWSFTGTYDYVIINGTANVTFTDSGSGGTITSTGSYTVVISGTATVKLEGGTYTGGTNASINNGTGNVGSLLADGYAYTQNGAAVTDVSSVDISNVTVQVISVKITAQPEGTAVLSGYTDAPTLSVTAEKTAAAQAGSEISYQWYQNGTLIEDNATSASYEIPTGLTAGTYTYYCAVTCDGYTVKSENATLSVCDEGSGDFSVTTSNNLTIYYSTLEEAITAAKGMPNSTVKLLAAAATASKVEVSSGTFTIDLNSQTWTSTTSDNALYLKSGSNVTLKDSGSGGTFTTSTADVLIYSTDSSLTIKNGVYENENSSDSMAWVIGTGSSGTVTIQGGTFKTTKDIMAAGVFQSVNLSISDGTFSGATVQINLCPSVALSGGTYQRVETQSGVGLGTMLASGYGYKKNGAWLNNPPDTYLDNVTVQLAPVKITAQPQGASATYGYTAADAPTLSVTAEKTATATADSTISYQWYVDGTAISGATSASGTLPTGLGAGTHSFYCAVSCDGYIVNSGSAEFTVEKATPTVTLKTTMNIDDPYVYGKQMYITATVTGVNGEKPDGTVTFKDGNDVLFSDVSFNTNVKSYQASSGSITAGDHSFTAVYNPSTDGTGKNYVGVTSAAVEQAIAKADQSTLSIAEVTGKKYGDGTFTLETTGGSGTGAVTFSVPEGNGVLSISGSTATILGAGTVTVTATNAGDGNYNSATATRDITIVKAAAPTINFPKAGGITYGQKLSASTLSESSNQYGTFAWTNGNTIPTVTNSGYEMTFTPTAATEKNYGAITKTTDIITIPVSKATAAVTVNASVSGDAGNRNVALTATVTGAGGGEAPTGTVKFVDTTSGSDADIAGAAAVAVTDGKATYTWTGRADQIYKVKAVYSGSGNYNTATSSELSFDTSKQNQAVLVIGSIGTKTYGDSSFNLTTTGGSGSGTLSYTSSDPTIVSISGAMATIHKAGTVTITATRAADSTYNEASATVSLIVGKKALTVKANDHINIIKGTVMPELTYTVTGLMGTDTFTSPTVSATAANTGAVGEYNITISGGTLSNADSYEVTYTNGRMTVVNAVYTVTVTNGTGGGSYSAGQTVTITAASHSGYTFTGWSSSDGVTFASSTASTTTFIMLGKAVTVTANYSKNSSGDGGGSSGGGGSSTTGTTIPVLSDAGKTSVSASVSGSTAVISATDSQIAAIVSSAKETGTVTVDISSLKVNAVTIPSRVVSSVQKAEGSDGLEVALPTGTVTLDQTALAAVTGKGDVKLSVETVDNSKLTDTQKATLGAQAGTAFVVDVNVYAGGNRTSTFNDGKITVSVPYTLKSGENPDSITVWFIKDDGTIEPKTASYANGKVTFTTEHLSQYLIVNFPFTDVAEDAWCYGSVAYVYDNGLFSGTSATTFSPSATANRQMIWMVLARMDGKTPANMAEAKTWAVENGISDGSNPSGTVTRQQMATILYRYAQHKGYDTTQGGMDIREFADYDSISTYAQSALAWAVNAGLVQGSHNQAMPLGNATRAQVATILMRFSQNVAK